MSRLLIQLSHLCKSFGNAHILQDVSLPIHEGDLIALIGENGAGKSTLLKIVEGVLKEDAGQVKRVTPLRIGILPQEIPVLATKVSVREYIEDTELLSLERAMEMCL